MERHGHRRVGARWDLSDAETVPESPGPQANAVRWTRGASREIEPEEKRHSGHIGQPQRPPNAPLYDFQGEEHKSDCTLHEMKLV